MRDYVVGGFSAGAMLAALWGYAEVGYRAFRLPTPKALFLAYPVINPTYFFSDCDRENFLETLFGRDYTDEMIDTYNVSRHIIGEYPPCYIVCAKDDPSVPCGNSEILKRLLDSCHVPCILDIAEHGLHGFGSGIGTDAEGWLNHAVDFWESL